MSGRSIVAVAFASLGLAVLGAGPAIAHAALTDTSPRAKSSVSEISEVTITANEELLDIGKNAKGFVIAVSDEDGAFYGDGCVSVKGDTASMDVSLTLRGKYKVAYRVISNDGHPVEGKFFFDFEGNADQSNLVRYSERPVCGKTPVSVIDESATPTEPDVMTTSSPVPSAAPEADITPWIGLATIPLIVGAIWILVRLLGKRDAEDHLD